MPSEQFFSSIMPRSSYLPFVLNQQTSLDFHSAILLKQQSVGRHALHSDALSCVLFVKIMLKVILINWKSIGLLFLFLYKNCIASVKDSLLVEEIGFTQRKLPTCHKSLTNFHIPLFEKLVLDINLKILAWKIWFYIIINN
jgi:hypothetical protein